MKKTITLFFLLVSFASQAAWQSMSGLNGRVRATVMYNNQLIAAGDFTSHNRVAKFNGSTWQVMGDGLGSSPNDKIYCLAVYNTVLFAGGVFSSTGNGTLCSNVAYYNPATDRWTPISGNGLAGEVRCFYNNGTNLLAGGTFSGRVAALDPLPSSGGTPSNWTTYGPSNMTGVVNDIRLYNNEYYITGQIFSGGAPYLIGKLNPTTRTFTPLTFVAGSAYGTSLEVYDNKLCIGGQFNFSSNFGLAFYNGVSASIFPFTLGESNDTVNDLFVYGGALYAAGSFDRSASTNRTLNKFFKYVTGKPVSSVDNGFAGGNAYCVGYNNVGNYFVCGGDFTSASNLSASNIARSSGMTIGIDEPENLVLDHIVFPNPVIQSATVRFTSREYLRNASLQVIDQQGRNVSNIPAERTNDLTFDFPIDRAGLPAGIYYYFLESDNSSPVGGKFVVQ